MDFNKLWQKHFPHLSPKEAHAELMIMFEEEQDKANKDE